MQPAAPPPDGPVKPDADAIFGFINVWDHKCGTPRDCPHRSWSERGATTRFARRLGRRPQSFWNLRAPGKLIGSGFITQIADALRVPWTSLALPRGEAVQAEDPQPQRKAA